MEPPELTKTNASEKLKEVQSELLCSICHDYFVQAFTASCSHSFCLNCISAWRKNNTDCPVCRREILGLAPSRALDNMVAALNNTANPNVIPQDGSQPLGLFNLPQNSRSNQPQNTQTVNYSSESTNDESYDEEEEEEYGGNYSYSDGSYAVDDDEEEEDDGESEENEDEGEEEEEQEEEDEDYDNSETDQDEDMFSDDEDYDEHVKRSNGNNPNNDEYWKQRGWSSRPSNWKDIIYKH